MTLIRYFSRAFVGRFLAALLGFSGVLQLLDLLDTASTVLEHGQGMADILVYIGLRLPMLMSQVVPLAVLIGLLTTFFSFARHDEIVAMRFAGISPWYFLKLLVPAMTAITVLHFLFFGQVVPWTERALRDWWAIHIAPSESEAPSEPVWIRAGADVVSIARVADKGRRLSGVTIVSRDGQGRTKGRVVARAARWDDEQWTLRDVDILTIESGGLRETRQDTLAWPDGPAPENIAFVADPPQVLSPQRSLSILSGVWSGTKRLSYYETQIQTVFSIPISSFVMLLLTQPALRGVQRGERFGAGAAAALGLGLVFLLVQGLMSALAETNTLPPVLGVWGPLVLFACIGGTILLYLEE